MAGSNTEETVRMRYILRQDEPRKVGKAVPARRSTIAVSLYIAARWDTAPYPLLYPVPMANFAALAAFA